MYFSNFAKIQLAISLLKQLRILHGNDLVHTDLHNENIMYVPANYEFKFIDYGDAEKLTKSLSEYDQQKISGHIKELLSPDPIFDDLDKMQKKYEAQYFGNKNDSRLASLKILDTEIEFLTKKKNNIPMDMRITNIGVFDIASNLPWNIQQLNKYPLVILIDRGNMNNAAAFAKWKHELEKQGVFVYDQGINNAAVNVSQLFNHLYNLMHSYNPESGFQFMNARSDWKITECKPLICNPDEINLKTNASNHLYWH